MPVPLFNPSPSHNLSVAAPELAAKYYDEWDYRAALVSGAGSISAAQFVEFSDRFAQLCDQTYGGTAAKLSLDRNYLTDTALDDDTWLQTQKGDNVALPVETALFEDAFSGVNAVELKLSPQQDLPGMKYAYAQVRWERRQADIMSFYAQGGSSEEGRRFLSDLYGKMFHVPESAPRKGLEAMLGICATSGLRPDAQVPAPPKRRRWLF